MYRAPRGTSDILPAEQPYWRYVERLAANICNLYGYERIDLPVFEDTQLFMRSVGEETDITKKEMYTFEDRGGNSLTLRPEGTASVCRAYLEHGLHNLPQPVKLFYIASIFRYERPQAGRYRQHYQFGFEAIGSDDPALDAEVIDMVWGFFGRLGIQRVSLKLNSIGCKQCRPQYQSALKNYYTSHAQELCPECEVRLRRNPIRLLDCKMPLCQTRAESAPNSLDYLCTQCAEHFHRLMKYLRLLELPFMIDHRLVRGLDYYTKTVFEVQPQKERAQSTLGGGGRYDELIEELGGKHTPAIGFGTGIERIIVNLMKQEVNVPPLAKPRVFIAYLGDEAKDEVVKLASSLRAQGIGVIEALGGKSLRAQLRQANSFGIQHVVIVGEEEVKAGTVMFRDMNSGKQEKIPVGQLQLLLGNTQ